MTSLLLGFSTLVLAVLASWRSGSFPWEVVLLAVLMAALDRGAAALRTFFALETTSGRRRAWALVAGAGLFAFAAVLILALSLQGAWPLLLLGAPALAAVLIYGTRNTVPSAPWGELLAAAVPGVLLYVATAFLFTETAGDLEFWWKSVALSVPGALYLASLATVRRSCEHGKPGHGVLLLPLAAYVAEGILAATRLAPWTFFLALVLGPALSAPVWRLMFRRGFDLEGKTMAMAGIGLLIFTLISAVSWMGSAFP